MLKTPDAFSEGKGENVTSLAREAVYTIRAEYAHTRCWLHVFLDRGLDGSVMVTCSSVGAQACSSHMQQICSTFPHSASDLTISRRRLFTYHLQGCDVVWPSEVLLPKSSR
jgi:hypothetical protein